MSIDIEKIAVRCIAESWRRYFRTSDLEVFAAAIIEQCALVCDESCAEWCRADGDIRYASYATSLAEAIRALKPPV